MFIFCGGEGSLCVYACVCVCCCLPAVCCCLPPFPAPPPQPPSCPTLHLSFIMPKYSRQAENPTKAAQAGGTHLRTHYKKAREVGAAIKGMDLPGARRFLEDVLKRKQAVPFLRYTGGCGRHAQVITPHRLLLLCCVVLLGMQ